MPASFSMKTLLSLGSALLALASVVLLSSVISPLSYSSELGVSTLSPNGEAGGRIVPASCPSYVHFSGECSAPSFSASVVTSNDEAPGPAGAGAGAADLYLYQGGSADLSWACSYGSTSGFNFSTGGATSGSAEVSPDDSLTTYTVYCANGTQGSVTIGVVTPEISIAASPALIRSGRNSTISWTATNVPDESCSFSGPGISISNLSAGDGVQTVGPLTGESTFTLSCQLPEHTVSASATVYIIPSFIEQ